MTDTADTTSHVMTVRTGPWSYRPGQGAGHYLIAYNQSDVAEFMWLRPVAHETVAMQRLIDSMNRTIPPTASHEGDWVYTARSIRCAVWEFTPAPGAATVLAVMWRQPPSTIRAAATIVEQLLGGLNAGRGLDPVTVATTGGGWAA